jgi:bile acid:Na+ symporter, BASS family
MFKIFIEYSPFLFNLGSHAQIGQVGASVIIVVAIHNTLGMISGYWSGRLLVFDESTCRTMSFEVGIQNSALVVTLGTPYFSVLSAFSATVFSVWHNISGWLLVS